MIDKSGELAAMAVAIPGLHEAAKRAMEVLAAAGNVAACNGLGWRERALKVEAERDALRSAIMDARAMLVESCLTGSTALVYRIDLALDASQPMRVDVRLVRGHRDRRRRARLARHLPAVLCRARSRGPGPPAARGHRRAPALAPRRCRGVRGRRSRRLPRGDRWAARGVAAASAIIAWRFTMMRRCTAQALAIQWHGACSVAARAHAETIRRAREGWLW